jgi:chromosome segregation ATPase
MSEHDGARHDLPDNGEGGEQQVHIELAGGDQKPDPVASVQQAELRNLADAFRHMAELMDELRGQHQSLSTNNESLKQRLDELGLSIAEWKAFQEQERMRIEEKRSPVDQTPVGKTKKPFSPIGF